jgi:hypothetical protein
MFKDEYTTTDLVLEESLVLNDSVVEENPVNPEKDKIVLSNDAYAIGQLLESLINALRSR